VAIADQRRVEEVVADTDPACERARAVEDLPRRDVGPDQRRERQPRSRGMQPRERLRVERLHDHGFLEPVALDGVEDARLPLGRRILEVDQQARLARVAIEEGVERFRPDELVEGLERRTAETGHGARVPGDALQRRVVHEHQVAVRGGPDVELEHVGALGESQVEGRKRVLRGVCRRAAMGHHVGSQSVHAGIEAPGYDQRSDRPARRAMPQSAPRA